MEQGVVDNVARMKAIKGFLDSVDGSNDSIAAKAELLDELTEIVENIDFARGRPPGDSPEHSLHIRKAYQELSTGR